MDAQSPEYLAPRRCFRAPVAEIAEAASLLAKATDAHLAKDEAAATQFIRAADMAEVRAWTESLWGSAKVTPDLRHYIRYRPISASVPVVAKASRTRVRMPTAAQKAEVLARYGRHCAFCGNPLIRAEVRNAFRRHYPEAAYWGATNTTQHAAFQCLWLQYDHVVPHARGGDESTGNLVPTCAGCNYGRVSMTLEEVGLLDPRLQPIRVSDWDGLERILTPRCSQPASSG